MVRRVGGGGIVGVSLRLSLGDDKHGLGGEWRQEVS